MKNQQKNSKNINKIDNLHKRLYNLYITEQKNAEWFEDRHD